MHHCWTQCRIMGCLVMAKTANYSVIARIYTFFFIEKMELKFYFESIYVAMLHVLKKNLMIYWHLLGGEL